MELSPKEIWTHGIEIEQNRSDLTSALETFEWHHDLSGPHETDIGPAKYVKTLLNKFYRGTRDVENSWEWKNELPNGSGCGSHVHFHFDEPEDFSHDEIVEGWTIAYNSLVELTSLFSPFWCHDWENGFRSSVSRWAAAQTTRYSQSSMERHVRSWSGRDYSAVTLNNNPDKPLTAELRLNEGHPAMALSGTTFMRTIIRRCIEEGWSPKFAGDRRALIREMYSRVYSGGDLFENMKEPLEIEFEEGRGIPGIDRLEFDSMWDLLESMLKTISTDRGTYGHRCMQLVRSGEARNSPTNNPYAIWQTDADRGDFSWQTLPAELTE